MHDFSQPDADACASTVATEPAGAGAAIVRDSLGVGLATGAYGVSFGAVSVAAGLSVAQTCALSLLMFTGASQFALVGVLAAGGAPLSGALTALLLGTRNTLYGLRLAPLLHWPGWRRLLAAHLVIDESTAMSVTRPSRAAARLGFLTTGLAVFVLWNLATLRRRHRGNRRWATPAPSASTPRSAPRSWRCCGRACGTVATGWSRWPPPPSRSAWSRSPRPGVPVLAAAGVALLAGALSDRPDPTEIPEAHR